MKKFFGLLFAFAVCFGLSGCGDSGSVNVMENAEQSAVEAYEAEMAAQEEGMSADFQEGDEAAP